MAMKLVQVTAKLTTESGRPLAGATIRAELDRWDLSVGGAIAMPAATSVQTDAVGQAEFKLWSTGSGSFTPTYRITISHHSTKTRVIEGIAVPEVAEISLTRLLGGRDIDTPVGAIEIGGGYFVLSTGTPVFI